MDDRRATRFVVYGRVQGVGFRYWTMKLCLELGLRGWVKNLPDGSVEIVAFGERAAIDELADSLWQGPRFAAVRSVDREAVTQDPGATFRIR